MFKFQKLMAVCCFGLLSATAFSQGDVSELKIKEVFAEGTGCHSDTNGLPIDWDYSINNELKTVSIEFSKFNVLPETRDRMADCDIEFVVQFPKGKTLYIYESQVIGEAFIDKGQRGKVDTALVLPSSKNPARRTHKLREGLDGRFETRKARYQGKQEAPCGAKNYPIEFKIVASMTGKKSDEGFVKIRSHESAVTNLRYRWMDCK